MPTINLPTYEQVDNIETVISDGLGTKWEDYAPLSVNAAPGISTTETSIYNVSGEGFFNRIVLSTTQASSQTFTVKVIIDGTTYRTFTVGNTNITGIFGMDSIFYNDTNSNFISFMQNGGSTTIVNKPIAGVGYNLTPTTASGSMTLIGGPIFFKNSLVIRAAISSVSGFLAYNLEGGIK